MKKYNLPLMRFGGGGYAIQNVARTYETALFSIGNQNCANRLPQDEYYFEYFGPDLKLHVSSPNMTNQKTPDNMMKSSKY